MSFWSRILGRDRPRSTSATPLSGLLPAGVWELTHDPAVRNLSTTGRVGLKYLDGPKDEFVADLTQAERLARSRVVKEKVYVAAIMVEGTDGNAHCVGGYTRAPKVRRCSDMTGFDYYFQGPGYVPPPLPKKSFDQMFNEFVVGKEDGFVLTNAAGEMGAAVVPELRRRLTNGLHGPEGRAAVIALGKIDPELALPLIEAAFGSMYNATRYYAAEYLANHPTEAAQTLSRNVFRVEKDEDTRKLLTRCINAT